LLISTLNFLQTIIQQKRNKYCRQTSLNSARVIWLGYAYVQVYL